MLTKEQLKNLSYNLRLYRFENNLTQEDLRDLTGLNIATINAIENEKKKNPYNSTLMKLAKGLNKDLEELLERK